MGAAERLEALCQRYARGDLAEHVAGTDAEPLLDRVLATAREGGDPARLDGDLDRMEAALSHLGIDGVTTSDRSYRVWRGGAGHPVVHALVCPARTCSRAEPDTPVPPPCAVHGRSLDRVQIPT
ncbi:hypothetical protein ACFPIJ_50960 [Dactylosporangium cerinum]|uniref:Uncharacterized protein n=1 Tax=Dactylosporangium cerinum TaxID=1434730 RepID=A0ABV9WD09_9ACTN